MKRRDGRRRRAGSAIIVAVAVALLSSCGGSSRILLATSTTAASGVDPTPSAPSTTTAAAPLPAPRQAGTATLPPGAALPSDAACATRVVASPESRLDNAAYNRVRGHQKHIPERWLDRVTGDFTGTTDEILQWTACKWGIDVNVVRAQAAKESWWHMSTLGDYGTDASACAPGHALGVDGQPGQCPQSYGILQVRYPYHGPPAHRPTWPEAVQSTAYNADYTYGIWRGCYEGDDTWLNTVDHGATYRAGDLWGCVGVWFSGRWYTAAAKQYIAAVRTYYNEQVWRTSEFSAGR